MSMLDSNAIIRAYLAADAGLIALVGARIYCPRLPENATLPAIGFFVRGGTSTPYIPGMPSPSVQFDCWALQYIGEPTPASMRARELYRALYDALQGIQNTKVTIGTTDYYILSAIEEVQGQDLVDTDIPNYFRVLTFFSVMLR